MNAGIATERAMKRVLDGTFVRIVGDRYERRVVPRYYLPDRPIVAAAPPKVKKPRPSRPDYRHFSDIEDKIIIGMSRSRRYTMRQIASRLHRSLCSVTARKHELKKQGRL